MTDPNAKPAASSAGVSARMRKQRERDTKLEAALRAKLWHRGLRYRLHYRAIPGSRREVDIAFPGRKVAVFVDGCFWHGCTEHRPLPASNRDWWSAKIEENRTRDRDTDDRLREQGWTVLRIWEHEDIDMAADTIRAVLRKPMT